MTLASLATRLKRPLSVEYRLMSNISFIFSSLLLYSAGPQGLGWGSNVSREHGGEAGGRVRDCRQVVSVSPLHD